jgi:hypothetical protein
LGLQIVENVRQTRLLRKLAGQVVHGGPPRLQRGACQGLGTGQGGHRGRGGEGERGRLEQSLLSSDFWLLQLPSFGLEVFIINNRHRIPRGFDHK